MTLLRGFRGVFDPRGRDPVDGEPGWYRADGLDAAVAGEFTNARALCEQLQLPAHTAAPRLLHAAWRRWSDDALARLDGVFALALRSDRELRLYRDRSGLRHLYWRADADGRVAFATELDAWLAPPGAPAVLCRPALHEYLHLLDIAGPCTLFDGVELLPPRQLLRWPARAAPAELPQPAAGPATGHDSDAAVDALAASMQRALHARLDDAQRPAILLSGGIDSALLCAIAARVRDDLTAYTVGFDDEAHDESALAARIAAHLGVRHQVLRFGRDEVLCAFDRMARHCGQPVADPAAMATLLAFERIGQRHDVAIEGSGADEALGQWPPRHQRVAVQWASRLPRPLRAALARGLRVLPRVADYAPIVEFDHPAQMLRRWHGFSQGEVEALCGEPVSFGHTLFYRTFARFARGAHFERSVALLDTMPGDRLTQAMRRVDLNVRFPYFDNDVNDLLRRLPDAHRFAPGQPKRILRALLARDLPASIWDVPKHGFNFPLRPLLQADDHRLLRRHLDPDRWKRHGLLSADEVQRHARRFIAGEPRALLPVWALVVLGAWLEHHPLGSEISR